MGAFEYELAEAAKKQLAADRDAAEKKAASKIASEQPPQASVQVYGPPEAPKPVSLDDTGKTNKKAAALWGEPAAPGSTFTLGRAPSDPDYEQVEGSVGASDTAAETTSIISAARPQPRGGGDGDGGVVNPESAYMPWPNGPETVERVTKGIPKELAESAAARAKDIELQSAMEANAHDDAAQRIRLSSDKLNWMSQQSAAEEKAALQQKAEDYKRLASEKIDAGRMWRDPWSILTVIGAAMVASASPNDPGVGMRMIENAVKQDVDIQISELERKRGAVEGGHGVLRDLIRVNGNMQDAVRDSMNLGMVAAGHELKGLASRFRGADAKRFAHETALKLEMTGLTNAMDFWSKMATPPQKIESWRAKALAPGVRQPLPGGLAKGYSLPGVTPVGQTIAKGQPASGPSATEDEAIMLGEQIPGGRFSSAARAALQAGAGLPKPMSGGGDAPVKTPEGVVRIKEVVISQDPFLLKQFNTITSSLKKTTGHAHADEVSAALYDIHLQGNGDPKKIGELVNTAVDNAGAAVLEDLKQLGSTPMILGKVQWYIREWENRYPTVEKMDDALTKLNKWAGAGATGKLLEIESLFGKPEVPFSSAAEEHKFYTYMHSAFMELRHAMSGSAVSKTEEGAISVQFDPTSGSYVKIKNQIAIASEKARYTRSRIQDSIKGPAFGRIIFESKIAERQPSGTISRPDARAPVSRK